MERQAYGVGLSVRLRTTTSIPSSEAWAAVADNWDFSPEVYECLRSLIDAICANRIEMPCCWAILHGVVVSLFTAGFKCCLACGLMERSLNGKLFLNALDACPVNKRQENAEIQRAKNGIMNTSKIRISAPPGSERTLVNKNCSAFFVLTRMLMFMKWKTSKSGRLLSVLVLRDQPSIFVRLFAHWQEYTWSDSLPQGIQPLGRFSCLHDRNGWEVNSIFHQVVMHLKELFMISSSNLVCGKTVLKTKISGLVFSPLRNVL